MAEELFQLSSLQELILHGNRLIGSIPMAIGSLKNLRVLDLGKNLLSGPIPTQIGNLVSVVTINLQSNGLTGMLPWELGKLQNLQELLLDRNRLSGTIPFTVGNASILNRQQGFCRSSPLKFADFSYNFIVGKIPKCLEYLPKTSFRGNCLLYKDIKPRTPAQCGAVSPATAHKAGEKSIRPAEVRAQNKTRNSKSAWILAVEAVTGVMIGSLVLIAIFTFVVRFKSKPFAKFRD